LGIAEYTHRGQRRESGRHRLVAGALTMLENQHTPETNTPACYYEQGIRLTAPLIPIAKGNWTAKQKIFTGRSKQITLFSQPRDNIGGW